MRKSRIQVRTIMHFLFTNSVLFQLVIGLKVKVAERRVPELIPVLGSLPAGDMSHVCRLPLHSARPAVTPATLKRAAASFAAW